MAGEETYAADYADDYEEGYYEEAAPAPSGGRRPGGAAGGGPARPGGGSFRPRRKVCSFCVDKKTVNYKDVSTLQRFLDDHGKIKARRKTGTCARHQRRLAVAIKRARHLALLPFTAVRSPYTER